MTARSLIIAIVLSILAFNVLAQKGEGPDKIKMGKAKLKYNEQDYAGALKIYQELAAKSPQDAELNFRMAECYQQFKDVEKVVYHLEKARFANDKVDKLLHFMLGRAYQESGRTEDAIRSYESFYSVKGIDKNEAEQAVFYKKQCQTALALTQNPVNVIIRNLGENINSTSNDYHPSVTADGKTMIFTSRRGDGKSTKKDPNDDGFFEDIFITKFNDTTGKWNPSLTANGPINTENHDAAFSITADGNRIVTYINQNGGDLGMSKVSKAGKWSASKPFPKPINSNYWEAYGCLSSDGNTLYFTSERNGGQGSGDIWVSKKQGRDQWSKPENLGPKVNSPEDEVGIFLHPDGKTLFFSSKRSTSMGGYDIFKTTFDGAEWITPVNVGYPINTVGDDTDFVLSTDAKRAWFVSKRDNSLGGFDIYEADLSNYNILSGKSNVSQVKEGLSILKGTVIDKDANTIYGVVVKIMGEDGKLVNYNESDEEGNYFLTLPGDKNYTISVQFNGFIDYNEKVFLPLKLGGTETLVKPLVLERVK